MARHQVDSVLYPVVIPQLVVVGQETKYNMKERCYQQYPITRTEWKQVGLAKSIKDAKQQGFKIPILDLNYFTHSKELPLQRNYLGARAYIVMEKEEA